MKSVVDKISKLLAKARDDSLSQDEAALFADKVADLLAKHDLTEDDLVREEITEFHWHTTYADPWRRTIARAAAKLYFCNTYVRKWYDTESRRIRDGIVIVGRPEHIFVAKEMAEYLIDTVCRVAIQYAKDNPSVHYTQRKVRLSFERGMGEKLAQRLRDKLAAKLAPAAANGSGLPALYQGEDAVVKNYMDQLNLRLTNWRGSKLDNRHSVAGILAAEDVSLSDQITVADPGDPT